MADKVLHEVRFIETDDGYRLEIKGDKEQLRKMGFGPGMGFMPFGRMMRHKRRGRHMHRHGPHRHGKGKHGHGCGPMGWSDESEADDVAEKSDS